MADVCRLIRRWDLRRKVAVYGAGRADAEGVLPAFYLPRIECSDDFGQSQADKVDSNIVSITVCNYLFYYIKSLFYGSSWGQQPVATWTSSMKSASLVLVSAIQSFTRWLMYLLASTGYSYKQYLLDVQRAKAFKEEKIAEPRFKTALSGHRTYTLARRIRLRFTPRGYEVQETVNNEHPRGAQWNICATRMTAGKCKGYDVAKSGRKSAV